MLSPLTHADDPEVKVQTFDDTVKAKDFGSKFKDENVLEKQSQDYSVPPVSIREKVFEAAGISEHIEQVDNLDRDILYLLARRGLAEKIQATYKQIPPAKISKLIQEVKNVRRK